MMVTILLTPVHWSKKYFANGRRTIYTYS